MYIYTCVCVCVYICVFISGFYGHQKLKKLISVYENLSEKYDEVRNKRLSNIK